MFFKTFVFILGVAFVLANPIPETAETEVEKDNGRDVIEVDESKNPTSTQESNIEENETPKPFSTELPTEEPVKDQEEEQEEEEVQEPVTEKAPVPSSTEEVTEEVVEVTTEQPKKDQSLAEKIQDWLAGISQKLKEDWEAIKNKVNNIIH